MIITEQYMVREDGVALVRAYSDEGYLIEQDGTGAIYSEAIDPADSGRTYTETDVLIETETLEIETEENNGN